MAPSSSLSAPPDGEAGQACRYFLSYSGVKVPFNLVSPIAEDGLGHRNTYIRAFYDADGRLSGFEKLVYGEVELIHRYDYHANGALRRAEVTMLDEEPAVLEFDAAGQLVAGS